MKKKVEFKETNTDFSKAKADLTCWWEKFMNSNNCVVPNKAMLEGKFPKN